ncbi:MAG: Outer membrane protein assembly factor BamB [Phycisphaerae bacterium]|nr:Outer membrane protein assembly factor BamB [Phycisphaerae bacterium]
MSGSNLGVIPVLIGPMATFLAILPSLLVAVGVGLLSVFKPSGMKKLLLFFWHQKTFTIVMVVVIGGFVYASKMGWLSSGPELEGETRSAEVSTREWTMFRGGPMRQGRADNTPEPTAPKAVWSVRPQTFNGRAETVYSSPAVLGNRVYVASVTGLGPFNIQGFGGIHCFDADTGGEVWSYAPKGFRGTYSSPSVAYARNPDGSENRAKGYVVCGEGLHVISDARINCLDLDGNLLWQFSTRNHVESSPCIYNGRVYIGAGDDGYYCLALEPADAEAHKPKVIWHHYGPRWNDCETSPLVVDPDGPGPLPATCYLGLGNNGHSIVAVNAEDGEGKELWRINTGFPVFAPMAFAEGRLYAAMGNGDYIKSAADLHEEPAGEVWCLDVANGAPDKAPDVLWKFTKDDGLNETVLGSIAYHPLALPTEAAKAEAAAAKAAAAESAATQAADQQPAVKPKKPADAPPDGVLMFGSRNRRFYCLTSDGQLVASMQMTGEILTSPALGNRFVYFNTTNGTLYCMQEPALVDGKSAAAAGATPGMAATWTVAGRKVSLDPQALKQVWKMTLGAGVQFFSCPALARGHLYIGTPSQGLRCIGAVEPPTPRWTAGELGGSSDDSPVPADLMERDWYAPRDDEQLKGYRVTAPLMSLPEQLTKAQVERLVQAEQFIYAAVTDGGKSALVKYRAGELTREIEKDGKKTRVTLPREVWSTPFDRPIHVAPAGVSNDVYVVQSEGDGQPASLWCVNSNGSKGWNVTLESKAGGQFTLAGDTLFIWKGPRKLAAINRSSGAQLWEASFEQDGVGAPLALDGVISVAVCTRGGAAVLDGVSGQVMWEQAMPATPVLGPALLGDDLLVPVQTGLARISAVTGATVWHNDTIGRPLQPAAVGFDRIAVITARPDNGAGELWTLEAATGLPWRTGEDWYLVRRPPTLQAPATQPDAAAAEGPKIAANPYEKPDYENTDQFLRLTWVYDNAGYMTVETASGTVCLKPSVDAQGQWSVQKVDFPGYWQVETSEGTFKTVRKAKNDEWLMRVLGPENYLKNDSGWFVQVGDGPLTPLFKGRRGLAQSLGELNVADVVRSSSEASYKPGWYRMTTKGKLATVSGSSRRGYEYTDPDTGQQVGFEVRDDGGYIPLAHRFEFVTKLPPTPEKPEGDVKIQVVYEGLDLLRVNHRLAPATQPAPQGVVPPLMSASGPIFQADGNLERLGVPAPWAEPVNVPGEPGQVLWAQTPPETVAWYSANWAGGATTPIVVIGGQAYFATGTSGLFCMKQKAQ